MKKTNVFVYIDHDHGDVAVFTTLKKAKAHAEECWPCDPEDEEEYGMKWEDIGHGKWQRGEYQFVETVELQ